MTKFLVTCTKIYNGTMFVDAENNFEALDIAQNKLNENVNCINWGFGEATADYAEEDEEDNKDGDGEEESRLDPNYKPKYHVGEYIIEANYKDITDKRIVFFRIDDIRNGKYICSDGKEDDLDYLDTDVDLRLAEPTEISKYFKAHPKYNVGDFIVSECGTIYKVTNVENDKYDAENKIGDEETAITFFVDDKKYRLATDEEIKKYNNQSRPKYKVGDYSDGVPIANFDDDENHHTETFHREDFNPFDKVLVRDDNRCVWVCAFFSNISHTSKEKPYVTCGGVAWEQCVPYNSETAHLLGTTTEYNGKYKTW